MASLLTEPFALHQSLPPCCITIHIMGISVIFLCAGYGTRLERDIRSAPEGDPAKDLLGLAKAMLPIGGRPLISHWIELLSKHDTFTHFYIVTNAKFYEQFKDLATKYNSLVSVLNDKTTSNDTRMGSVASLNFAIEEFSLQNDDVLVVGGDTLFYNDFSISDFMTEFKKYKSSSDLCALVNTYTCADDQTHKFGILEIDAASKKVQSLTEKPQPHETKSRQACPCFYLISAKCTGLIKQFLHSKRNSPFIERDATGHFIKYLVSNCSVFTHQISGRFDVGGLQSYKECNDYFLQK